MLLRNSLSEKPVAIQELRIEWPVDDRWVNHMACMGVGGNYSARFIGRVPAGTGVALLWRRLGLVDAAGVPTLRGRIVSFFTQGDGLAIAAALDAAEGIKGKPSMIVAKTVKGKGVSFMEDDNNWHYRVPKAEEVERAKRELELAG